MLGNKNKNKKTVISGIGTAIFLCALMAFMPMSSLVDNPLTESVTEIEAEPEFGEYFKLPPQIEQMNTNYDSSQELLGMRDATVKGYVLEDGRIAQLTSAEPIHYLDDSGAFQEIDLNIKATPYGWEVSENTYTTQFGADLQQGVSVQASRFVDPIVTGINPTLVTFDSSSMELMPVDVEPSTKDVEVGGNVIRYPVADGYALDYAVHSTSIKQNLLIKEAPAMDHLMEYFGFTEMMALPIGYALYLDGVAITDEPVSTQDGLEIRNIETNDILALIPPPQVLENGAEEAYIGTYFVQQMDGMVFITTAVETQWLMSEERSFPLSIDPTLSLSGQSSSGECTLNSRGGYCRITPSWSIYLYRTSTRIYDLPFYKFTYSSSNQLPTGATVDEVNFVHTVSYDGCTWWYCTKNTNLDRTVTILEACGSPTTTQLRTYAIPTAACSGSFAASSITGSGFSTSSTYSSTIERQLISSIHNSPESGTYGTGTGKKTVELCDNANTAGTACTATGSHTYITNAATNTGDVALGIRMNSSAYIRAYGYSSSAALEVIFSGGTDAKPPTADFIPYTGVTSYVEGERTFFITLSDTAGIDTSTTGMPTLVYKVNSGSWVSATASIIQTCSSTATECKFKATTADIKAGDDVEYYWKFSDLAQSGANTGYHPAPPATNTAPESWARSNAHSFSVEDVANAGANDQKFQVLQTKLEQTSSWSSTGRYDKQMTYFDHSDEYLIEFDTTGCGSTSTTGCFVGSPQTNYGFGLWEAKWTTRPSTGSYGTGGTTSGQTQYAQGDGGYLTISRQHGPQMNLLFLYDSSANDFAMVGIGDSTPEIEFGKLVGGVSANSGYYSNAFHIPLSGLGITGTFAKFNWGGSSYSSSVANHMCVYKGGWMHFFSRSSFYRCYYSDYGTSSGWSGFGTPAGGYASQDASGTTTYKVSKTKPTPDTFAPDMEHNVLMDSHSKTRTFAYTIMDAGDPASGLNVNRTLNEGPTLHYSINNGTTTSVLLNPPAGVDIATCELNECEWSYTLTTLDRNDYVSYYATAVDKSTVASGTNTQTTSTNNFEVGDPNKMLIVEWRDIGYTSSTTCSFQAVFYDVTNEIEFKYDTGCKLTDDYSSTGFMDHTRTHGQHIRDASRYLGWTGSNPFTHNYRITTDGNESSVETFTQGMTEVQNAAEVISGTAVGQRMYYCASPYYWSRYTTQCNANIDLPGGFNFDYFEKSFDGDDADDRIRIGINGYMYFIDNGARSLEQGIYYWSSGNMPELPYNSGSGQQYAREGTIAPYWSWGRMSYDQLYCYDTNTVDCGVYVRVLPFEGKGTEIETDLDCASSPSECIWDTEGSPYRINPSNDYLSISGGDLTIEPGTVIQVETGKGISFDGQCDSFKAEGEENNRIVFEGQNQGEWKGISFTDDCATTGGTDDRHVFSYVDFNNTSSAAISAGSRHSDYSQVCTDSNGGQRQCSSDKNVGNFTMTDVTFTNVETAIRHGSGAGTGITMSDFTINGADKACINLPKSSDATIKEGTMTNCNTDGETWGGAIVTFPGSTGGMLHVENVTITNAYYNLISTDVQHVTVSNVTASVTSGAKQAGTVFTSNFGVDSEVNLFNFVADDYTSATINALKVINMTEVNWGQDTDLTIVPGGTGSTANGPFGTNAILDDVTVGDMMIYRMQPSIMNDVTSGHIDISGDAIVSDAVTVTNLDSGRFGVAGCGWTVLVTTIDADRVYSACTSSQSKNTMKFEDGTLTHTSNTDHAVYGRNSRISLGEIDITSSNAGNGVFLAYASQNTQIILIEVSQNGDDCADGSGSTGDCDTSSTSGSATIYYGGLAELETYRLEVVSGVVSQVPKSGQTVTTSLVDSLNAQLFEVGSHITGSNGKADVWVVTGDSSGNTYSNHNLRAFGSAGQNETLVTDPWYITDLSTGFTIGTSYALELKPAPKDFNGTNMDCAWLEAWRDADTNAPLPTNGTTSAGETIFEFDGTPITVSEDLTLDGCEIRLFGAEMKVKSTATNSPVISITNGGKLLVGENPTSPGALQAVSPSYPMTLLVQDGLLEVSGGVVRDLAQDTTTGAALYIGANAELVLNASGSIYGASTLSDDMATVKVEGGKITVDSGSIINTGVTGTALWIESSGGSLNNIAVSNAAVGIKAKDSAPQIDGFTSTGSDVGLDIDGGMTLPTIYRSTSLSGESRGWKTYPIDLSNFLGNGDYLQVGANSIYGGGNAHPRTQYSVNYYMISDRWNIEITYDDGSGEVSENVTSSDKLGYYPYGSTSSSGVHSTSDPASGNNGVADYAGGEGGVASWHCSYSGNSYGPAYTGTYDGNFRDIYQYWPEGPQTYVGWSFQGRLYPAEFGFRWSEIDESYTPPSFSYYPYHYWSIYQSPYSWSSSGGWTGDFISPEGNNGHRGYYNVCADGAYKSRWGTPTPTGAGARMSFPIVDISSPTITAVTMYVDVLHNRADNFQDRFEFVARSGNDPSALGDYKRESGVATFKNGVINGADTGVILGGSDAAATIESVTVNSPVFAGLDVDGSIGGSSIDDLEVNGGDYGMYISSFARGQMDVTNFDFDAQDKAGIYYVTDMMGTHTGTITNSNGAAYKYGANTVEDIMFDSITLSGNSIGIETAGSGDITIKDSTFTSVDEDIRITGTSEVDFVEGTIDSTSVVVTGTGGFDRQRALALTLDADSTAVEGATVLLMNGDGKVTGNAVTDASGIAQDLRFRTIRVDSSGLTTETLAGYEISTIAEVEYSTTVADFRYAFEAVTLQDNPGNAATVSLTDNIDTRFCYGSTSTRDYNTVGPRCSGTHYLSTSGDRTKSNGNGGTITEYGYRGNDATFSNKVSNMNGKTIMVDAPFMYLEDGVTHNWNESVVFMTARYSWSGSSALDTQRWYADGGNTNPSIYMHNTDIVGLNYNAETENVVGLTLGYYSDALDISIKDSSINPVASITSGMSPQYSWWWWYNSDYTSEFLRIENTSMTHYKGQEKGTNPITSVPSQDVNSCVQMYGTDGSYIIDSEFNNCPIGVYSARSIYYTGHSKSEYGADNLTIENNTFEDGGESYDIWIAGNAYADNTLIKDNNFTSAGANAGVRVSNSNTITNFGTKIIGNTFAGPQTPVYVADVGEYVVAGNDLTGTGDSTRIGIDIEGGYGDVSNNTLVDVDGGIVISDSIEAPGPTNVLCKIGETSYTSTATCTFTVSPGAVASVDLDTDRYGYEISMVITKPDGSSDSWSSFWSNRFYSPLRTYTTPGTYTLTVSDRAADGGAEIEVYEQVQSSSYAGPTVENNSISLSANRLALNAIGISLKDCSKVEIYSKDNTIAIGDNAVSVDGCDLNDVDSVITGSNYLSSVGISSTTVGDSIVLDGTTVSGYGHGVEVELTSLTLQGDASISGSDAAVYADSATVTAIGASVDGGSTGTGLYMVDGGYSWIYPLDAAGDVGVYAENTEFRWDGGVSTATTALHAVESEGSVENLTWAASTTQINAGSNSYITSIGQVLDASKITIDPSATIDEANLFSLDATHLMGAASNVGMTIISTDGTRAAYVSPAFQPDVMTVDGDSSDWFGYTPLNPSDDAKPGNLSGDGTKDFYVTYTEGDTLYIAMSGEDLSANDLLIYMDVATGGSTTGYNLNGAHTLPMQADYLFWATSVTNMDLFSNSFLGWGSSSLSSDAITADLDGNFFEIAIPFSRIGGTPDEVNIVAIVQDSSANVQTVHPTQTVTTGVQTLSEYISVETTHNDLATGSISDEILVYHTYKGTTTPGTIKNYDVMLKTKADCEYDWHNIDDISMLTRQDLTADIERACPEIKVTLADTSVDEDSEAYVLDLNTLADDNQQDVTTLTWTVASGTVNAYNPDLVAMDKNGKTVTILPLADQFGTAEFEFVVTDKHGLTDTKNITITVNNINDKPVICNQPLFISDNDCTPVFVEDLGFTNIVPEGFGEISQFLGNTANATKSYIRDMDNENFPVPQVYTWGASVPSDCEAFSVSVTDNVLSITENKANEFGGTCTITLTLSDDGNENQNADSMDVEFKVSPVNDAPVILDWDVTTGAVITADNGSTPVAPWAITFMEDDLNPANLTYDLSAVKDDIDHSMSELQWTVEPTSQCAYENYFSITIVEDELRFSLVPDATTTANAWEIDYLNDNGIHQIGPSGSDFCQISLVLKDTLNAPADKPNYDPTVMPIADYQQGEARQELGVRIMNVKELVADYYLDDVSGFDFQGINNVLTGTYVPVEVEIGAGGDQGPYTYDHMLAVTFHTSGGHGEAENVKYMAPPAWGETITVKEYVYIVDQPNGVTPYIWVEVDVLTCLDTRLVPVYNVDGTAIVSYQQNDCDLTRAPADRFQTDSPSSHVNYAGGVAGDQWSKPGAYGDDGLTESQRRPLLQDSNWCNNVMFSNASVIPSDAGIPTTCNHVNKPAEDFLSSNDVLPSVVVLGGGVGSVPSFAPSLVVVALAGFFVTALAMASRREEEDEGEEEETRRIVEDEMAVSPVIATILMVAITVVLSGVIYVWASSLAETGKLGVPRVTFDIENKDVGAVDGYWAITVDQTEAELATAGVTVTVLYSNGEGVRTSYATILSNTSNVYGFDTTNSDAFVTFVDKVENEGTFKESTFGIGDQIFVRTHAPDGTPITDATIRITYQPGAGEGSVIKTYQDLEYNKVV